jgi:hypothetical protein
MRSTGGHSDHPTGRIQDVALYTRALSAVEVREHFDSGIAMWAGAANYADAPWQVSNNGAFAAYAGIVGGYTIGADYLTRGTGTTMAGLNASDNTAFFAGSATPGSAPFRVATNGSMYVGRSYFGSTTGMDVEVGDSGTVNIVRGLYGTVERLNLWWDASAGGRISMPSTSKSDGFTYGKNFNIGGDSMKTFAVTTNTDTGANYANLLMGPGVQLYANSTPTGGDKGAGTINVTGGYYVNNVAIGQSTLTGGTCGGGHYFVDTWTVNSAGLVTGLECSSGSPFDDVASLRAMVLDLSVRLAALEAGRVR